MGKNLVSAPEVSNIGNSNTGNVNKINANINRNKISVDIQNSVPGPGGLRQAS
jgi:hypothetical protein